MKVIFIQNVKKQGKIDEVKDINEGYARNFLIPNKLAIEASPKALGELKKRTEQKGAVTAKHSKEFQAALDKLADFTLVIKKKANDEGHLFSSVTLKEILTNLKGQGIHLEEKNFDLRSPIKKTGELGLPIVGAESQVLKISIVAE